MCQAFNDRQQVDVIYIDLSKAFDRINRQALTTNVVVFGLYENLVMFVCLFVYSYLWIEQNVLSTIDFPLTSFCNIQGSSGLGLGLILFNLFINDIVDDVSGLCPLYAELFLWITSSENILHLQKNFLKFFDWCLNNGFDMNTDKCHVFTHIYK